MKLAEYLKAHDISAAEFARRIGVHKVTLSRYIRGVRRPALAHSIAIQKATRGKVKPESFVPADTPN